MNAIKTSVAIVGGGPAGLSLAIELGMRGVPCLLFDEKPGTTRHPQANATQARTMEHFRRMGFADEIRSMGLPADYPTDIAYLTRYGGFELARFRLPPAKSVKDIVLSSTGSWSTPELPHRCSQMLIERVLRTHAEKYATNQIRFGWRVREIRDCGSHVEIVAENLSGDETLSVNCHYLVGCDGPHSLVRKTLGIRYGGDGSANRDFMGGTMCAVYFRCPDLYNLLTGDRAWMYVSFNRDRRAFMAAVNGIDEFVFHTQLKNHELEDTISDQRAGELFEQALGRKCPIEVVYTARWNAGFALVAESYGGGRIFIAGDAAHLFTPTGGLGYNTAVDDVVNLGWKLAATINGWGGPHLVQSYVDERLPIGHRNTTIARGFADSIGNFFADPHLEEVTPAGEAARAVAGSYLLGHAQREFNIPGVTFGVRYDGSKIVWADAPPPQDASNEYKPSGIPGGRAPHLWVDRSQSLYDLFGPEFTLLCFSRSLDEEQWQTAAKKRSVPLKLLALDQGRDLYGADLVLIRPDQYVAWRGSGACDPAAILARVLGGE